MNSNDDRMTQELPAVAGEAIDVISARFSAAELYFGHGTDNAADEAAWLVYAVAALDFDDASAPLSRLSGAQKNRISELADARVTTRKPLAYLLGEAWFAGRRYYVDDRVLVPRSPFAELIREGFRPWLEPERVRRVLDLGTGSGCIAIACAHEFKNACVDAVDISADALAVTAINIERHGLAGRVNAIQSDFFRDLHEQRYDLIISNPPYVETREMPALPPEYLAEPALGLEAGTDGLDSVHTLLHDSPRFLACDGLLAVEVGNAQQALVAARPDLPFTWVEFEQGGDGVFVLEAADLVRQRSTEA